MITSHPSPTPVPSPRQPAISGLCIDLCILNISYKWNHAFFVCDLFYLTWHFQGSSVLPTVLFHGVAGPHSVHPFLSWRTFFGVFQFSAGMNNVAVNICVQVSIGRMFSFLLVMFLGAELLSVMVTLCLTFWVTARQFSSVATPACTPTSSACAPGLSMSSPTLGILLLIGSSLCEVVSCCFN